jgi:MarR family transcriptional regulator, organic hydroperoxide resistance regulator
MKKAGTGKGAWPSGWPPKNASGELPFEESIGYQVRATHRALQRYLQLMIEPYDIASGSWYFLRVLWDQDGLTQRELADRIGIREPTALIAIKDMESRGLVKRVRSKSDRRKIHVWLTPKGKALKRQLIPLARHVVATAAGDLRITEVRRFLGLLAKMQKSLNDAIAAAEEPVLVNKSSRPAARAARQ